MKKQLVFLIFIILLVGCYQKGDDTQTLPTNVVAIPHTAVGATDVIVETPITAATSTSAPTITPRERPRIILFIGDGMGSEHRLAGQYYSVGEIRQLMMDQLPVRGWLIPDPYGEELPDSASAATAFATGYKTYTEVISLDIDGNRVKTIFEYAKDLDMSVGLVTNKYITDATTAVFGAHVPESAMRLDIASQFIDNQIDVIFGGGEDDFLPNDIKGCYPKLGNRTDGRHLIDEAVAAGYRYVCDQNGFEGLNPQIDWRVIGLFEDENMTRPYSPSLAEMTRTAIEILSMNPKGYILVVEGAMIDIASHYHESQNVMDEVVWLDQAVEVGMEYAESDENSLLIVTADHETGGLIVDLEPSGFDNQDGPFKMPNGTEFYISWHTGGHTFSNVPVTAFGPVSDKFKGLHQNTLVFDVMLEFLGIPKTWE